MKYVIINLALFLCLLSNMSSARELRTGILAGELQVSEGKSRATVLIIPGSAPVNRDGDMPGMPTSVYRLLAEALEKEEITSLRIDKRGM